MAVRGSRFAVRRSRSRQSPAAQPPSRAPLALRPSIQPVGFKITDFRDEWPLP